MHLIQEIYMQRCLELALKGAGWVTPNPLVGAVLVYHNRIIGEGWHERYGQAHAEVNCIASVKPEDQHLIGSSTLYVSLEPCAHFGKTPPCSRLIIDKKIPTVVIGCRDPFPAVDGKGIEQLEQAGITVVVGVLEEACRQINRRFFTFHQQQRPWVIIKWAQTANGILGLTNERLHITNAITNRLVHRWRSEEAAILVGSGTVRTDNPQLTNRLWNGPSPVRMVIDRSLQLPVSSTVFREDARTIVFNAIKTGGENHLQYQQLQPGIPIFTQINTYCYANGIQSILVEGGAQLLQHCLDAGWWDELRVITNQSMIKELGVQAPELPSVLVLDNQQLETDHILFGLNPKHEN